MKHHQLPENCYLSYPVGDCMKNAKIIAKQMATILKKTYPRKEFLLIGRGSSGNILCSLVSNHCKVRRVISIKKEGEISHSRSSYMKYDSEKNCIMVIVDDFIATGETIRKIHEAIMEYGEQHIECLCVTRTVTEKDMKDYEFDDIISHYMG